jgi:hypothetical protein
VITIPLLDPLWLVVHATCVFHSKKKWQASGPGGKAAISCGDPAPKSDWLHINCATVSYIITTEGSHILLTRITVDESSLSFVGH